MRAAADPAGMSTTAAIRRPLPPASPDPSTESAARPVMVEVTTTVVASLTPLKRAVAALGRPAAQGGGDLHHRATLGDAYSTGGTATKLTGNTQLRR
jgi:hypothetical protein